jgi:hypothetical protein
MKIDKISKIILTIGIIFLFIIATISATGISLSSLQLNKGYLEEPPEITIEGILGENDWYIANVLLSYYYNPVFVKEIWYNHDGNWHQYQDIPIPINIEGQYLIPWYWINDKGQEITEAPIPMKLDSSKPTINIEKQVQPNSKVKFVVTCNDQTSGVERVEFYLDDELITTQMEKPYEYLYSPDGSGYHDVFAIGYDFAGHTEQSDTLDTKERSRLIDFSILNNLLQRISYIIYLIQQIYLG